MPIVPQDSDDSALAARKPNNRPKAMTSDIVKIGMPGWAPPEVDQTSDWEEMATKIAKLKWLVNGWITFGNITGIVAGPKGGKSAFVLDGLVKSIVLGRPLFNGQPARPPAKVLWCDTERRASLNLDRVASWEIPRGMVKTPHGEWEKVIDLNSDADITLIRDGVCAHETPLVIVDSFRGSHNEDENNSRIANGLKNLSGVAQATGAAICLIHHAGKLSTRGDPTIDWARGSNAYLASILGQIIIDIPDPTPDIDRAWRRIQVIGSNTGPPPPPIGFRITESGLEWGPAPARRERVAAHARHNAKEWLQGHMAPGKWYLSDRVNADAREAMISNNALQRAKEVLGIVKPDNVICSRGRWWCRLPKEPT